MESAELAARARRAYELSRLRRALAVGPWVLVFAGVSALVTQRAPVSLAVGGALLVVTVALRWWGRAAGAAVGPGLLAGVIPFALLLVVARASGIHCALEGCLVHCGRWCGAGGLASGLLLAAYARRRRDDIGSFLLAGGTVAALTGLLGCLVGGVGGALWMALAETVATLPAFALELRRR